MNIRTTSRLRTVALGGVAAALLLAGCSGDPQTPSTPGSDGAPVIGSVAEAVPLVRMTADSPARSRDPLQINSADDIILQSLTGGRLFEFAPGSSSEAVPSLAASATASDDGLQYTVQLREGLTFSDGAPLTAQDVAASIGRGLDSPVIGGGAVAYSGITAVEATAADTVTFDLAAPNSHLPAQLTSPVLSIYPAAAAEDPEGYFAGDIAVSGAYQIEGDWQGSQFAYQRNDAFGGTPLAVDRIEVSIVQDTAAAAQRLQAGDVDFVPIIDVTSITSLSGDAVGIATPSLGTVFLGPNNASGLGSDVRIRQALGWAIDREALGEVGFSGHTTPMYGAFNPELGYDVTPTFEGAPDLDKARELLAGTECENGCQLPISIFATDQNLQRVTLGVQSQLEPLGIEVIVDALETNTFIDKSINGEMVAQLATSPAELSWNPFQIMLDPAFTGCIFLGCENDEIVPAIEGFIAANPDEQAEAAQGIEDVYADWVPWIGVSSLASTYGVRTEMRDVVGYQPSGLLAIATLDD